MTELASHIIIFTVIFLAGIFVARVLYWLLTYPLRGAIKKSKTKVDDYLVYILREPMILFIVFFFLYLGRIILRPPEPFNMYLGRIITVLAILNIGFLIYKVFDFVLLKIAKPFRRKEKEAIIDSELVPLIKKLAAIFIFCIVAILCLENMGVDVTSLLAGLGIGGIAVALAAKETIANVFGAMTLISNPPFRKGDVVEIAGEIGTIEEIGMMNTIIEKFDSTHLIITNRKLLDKDIVNISRRRALRREIKVNLNIVCELEDIKNAIKEIKLYLESKPELLKECYVLIDNYVKEYMVLRIVYWVRFENYGKYLGLKNSINLAVRKILGRNNLIIPKE